MRFLLPLLALAILLSGCTETLSELPSGVMDLIAGADSGTSKDTGPQNVALISPDREVVKLVVEIADDSDERREGLMNRENLDEGTGMLFIFPQAGVQSFWMKNTLIPLDIIFMNGAGLYINHTTMQPCTEDPCPAYPSAGEAQLALEVNAGFVEQHGIGPGWRLAIEQSQDAT